MTQDTESFYLSKEEPERSCFLALRTIILAQDTAISETRKYGMPCFCYGKKAFCYLWSDKKTQEPYVLMVEGKHLNHPNLEAGDRARMKIFRVNASSDIPVESLQSVLQSALDLCRTNSS